MMGLHLSPWDWFWLILAGLSLLICLGLSVWEALPSRVPTTHRNRLLRALLGGAFMAGGVISLLAIGYILDKQTEWSLGDFFVIFLCCLFPLQLIATIGIYLGFLQQDWMRRQLNRLANRQRKDNLPHKQGN